MPTFTFTSPEGKSYDITGPEGATKAQAFEILQKKLSSTSKTDDKPKPEESTLHKIGDVVAGIGEAPLAVATGIAGSALGGIAQAGVAGYEAGKEILGGQRTPGSAQAVGQDVAQKLTYQPKSQFGQQQTSAIGEALSGFGLLPAAAKKIRETEQQMTGGRTTGSDIVLGAASALPLVKGAGAAEAIKSGKAGETVSGIARETGLKQLPEPLSMKEAAFVEGRKNGYVATPTAVTKSTIGALGESISNKAKITAQTSIKNSETRANDIRKDFGLPARGEISPDELSGVREKVAEAQSKLKDSVPELSITQDTKGKIDKLIEEYSYLKDKFPNLAEGPTKEKLNLKVDDLLYGEKISTADTLSLIRELRKQADEQLSVAQGKKISTSNEKQGGFNYHLANTLESMIEENLPQGSPLLKDFREGRKITAQTYNVQASLNPVTGEVIGRKLASLYDKSLDKNGQSTWSDGLKRAAEQAKAFPNDNAEISRKGGHPALNYWDYLVAGGTAAAGHPIVAATEIASRTGIPTLLSSKLVQNRLISKERIKAYEKEKWRQQRQQDLETMRKLNEEKTLENLKSLEKAKIAANKKLRHEAEQKALTEAGISRGKAIDEMIKNNKIKLEAEKRKREIESLMRQSQGLK
jgi:hypothetical protein